MTDIEAQKSFAELQAKCQVLEAQVAALTAFTCAILDANPRRDELVTRWLNYLSPALEQFAKLDDASCRTAAFIPGWVDTFPVAKRGPRSDS